MQCNKCGSTNLKLVESGPHDKLVCGDCLTFQKFLSISDALTFRRLEKDPTRLSDVDELKAKILRLVEDVEEGIAHHNEACLQYETLDQIKDLCK